MLCALKNKRIASTVCLLLVCIMLMSLPGCAKQEKAAVRFTKESDFSGATVASITGAVCDVRMSEIVDNVHYLYYDDVVGMVEALSKGEVDAIVDEDFTCRMITERREGLVRVPLSAAKTGFGYLLRKNSEYTDEINGIVESLYEDGTIARLQDKWIYGDQSRRSIDYSKYDLSDRGKGVLRVICTTDIEPMSYVGGR